MGHSHGHDHGSTSPQADRGTRRRLLIAFCITAIIVVAQAVGLSLIHISEPTRPY